MALEIPKLQQSVEIADKDGRPTFAFHRWWDSVARSVEGSFNNLIDNLIGAGVLKPNGTVAAGLVDTASIVTDAVTERYAAVTTSPVSLPDGIETDVVSLGIQKAISASEIDIDIGLRLESSDDIRGEIRVYRDSTVVDSFGPFMNGAGGIFRIVLTLPFTEFNIPAGTYTYRVTFIRDGGASSVSAGVGSIIRVKEIKR